MASKTLTITPDGVDDSGDNWSITGGLSAYATLASTSTTKYLYGTADQINTFTFNNPVTGVPVGVHWLQYNFNYSSSVGSEPMQIRVKILDGGDSDNELYNEVLDITGPSNPAKVNNYESPILPYHSGTTSWSTTNITNIKMSFQIVDNSVGDGSPLNQLQLHYVEIDCNMNQTDARLGQDVSTYPAKKGMMVSRGRFIIG